MNGLYLASPHASLVYSGEKSSIATGKRYPITGERLLCSKEDGVGLAFGVAQVGDPALLDIPSFDSRVSSHQVTKTNRRKWWPDARQLYDYPILRFTPFPEPIRVDVEPGVTMDMGEVSFPQVQEAIKSLSNHVESGDRLVIMSTPARIMSSSPNGEKEESEMPWTTADPPRPAKNWTAEEKRKCVAAANAAIRDDPKDEQGAIFACIRAAGKTQHPGGKKESIDPEDYVIAEELVKGFLAAQKGTAADNNLPDSAFLYVESGDKDGEGKTVPRSKRHLPYRTASGSLDLPRLRNALSRLGQPATGTGEDGGWLTPALRKRLISKAQSLLKGAKKELLDVALESDDVDVKDDAIVQLAEIEAVFSATEKAGDMGDGDTHTCTCPKCGTEVEKEKGSPCREEECPKCGTRMRGGDEDTESAKSTPTDSEEKVEVDSEEKVEEKAGRRINSSVLSKLKDLLSKLKEVIEWGDSTDKKPDAVSQIVSQVGKSFKTYSTKDGETWFEIWPTNSYQDRDSEFFTSAALKNFVERHEPDEVKGQAWFWHVPGSKFGTIYHQAIVEDHFLVQMGKFDDTPVGNAFKEFFSSHPEGHPVIAPWGWGASHGYAYIQSDRERDGIYHWLDIKESTVLPVHHAANVHNPRPYFQEVKMNDKQKEAFDTIGAAVGIPDLTEQILAAARLKKDELDGKVEHKSVAPPPDDKEEEEQVPEKPPQKEAGAKDESPLFAPEVVRALAAALTPSVGGIEEEAPTAPTGTGEPSKEFDIPLITKGIVEALQLDNLSTAFTALTNEVKELRQRLEQVERSDAEKVAAKVEAAPPQFFSWFQASQAEETVSSTKQEFELPDAVKAIAGLIQS